MKKIGVVLLFICACFFAGANENHAAAQTYTLQVKSTVDVLNVRQTPSEKAKIVGKLKKGQKLDVIYDVEDKGFFEVMYKGKKAYISNKYAQLVKPHKNAKWLGQYYDHINGGTGYYPNLTVYKQTTNKLYYASYAGERTVAKNGRDWAYKYKLYQGTATIVSASKASLKINGYKGTWSLKGNKIIPTQNAGQYVNDEIYHTVVPEYGEFRR